MRTIKNINIKGTIVSNDDKWIYDLFGIDATSPADIQEQLDDAKGDDVTFNINSGGGDVFAGNEIYYLISQYKGNTVADITGIAASIATVICCAADKVRAVPGAQYMIHNVSGGARGDYHAMDKASEILVNANRTISNTYRLKTGMSEKALLKLMDEETWMDVQRASNLNFIDEIIGDNEGVLSARKLYNANSYAYVITDEMREKAMNMRKENDSEQLNNKNNNPHRNGISEEDFLLQKNKLELLKLKNVR